MAAPKRRIAAAPPAWAVWGRVALGLMFLVAGVGKTLDPWSFLSALGSYGVPEVLRTPVAMTLPAIEVVVGVLLVAGWATRFAAAAAAVMMAMFIAAIGYGVWLGTLEECGCFGPFIQRSPRDAALIDLAMLAVAIAVWKVVPARKTVLAGWRGATLAGLGLASIAITTVLVVSGPTGVSAVSGGALDMRSVNLREGEHLLYLFHYECPHCAEMSPRVAEYAKDPTLPPVVGLTFRTPEDELDRYLQKYGMSIPAQVLAPQQFIGITGEGAVPQLVYVRDGRVQRSWLGLLPMVDELREELGSSR